MTAASEWNELNLVEKRLIHQLQELGYEHVTGSALESERESLSEVIFNMVPGTVRKRVIETNGEEL